METSKNTLSLNKELLQELLAVGESPCISLYMPTYRTHPENLQNPTRFKNLMKELEESLQRKYSNADTQSYLEPLIELTNQEDFWNHTSLGLAIFSASGFLKAINMTEGPEEMANVADSFHTKPLQRLLQSTDRFQVLALSLNEVKLFEGNRHALVEVELHPAIDEDTVDALGEDLDRNTLNGPTSLGHFHFNQSHRKDNADGAFEKYFREVATSVNENYSKRNDLPLVLAALPEHHNLFQKISGNAMLLEEGIKINPTTLSTEKMAELAWEIIEPEYLRKQEELVSRYNQAKADGLGSEEIKEVAVALVEGRVDTLIIESDRIIASRITNLVTGNVQNKDIDNPKVDDLLDDMSELAMRMGGRVTVLTPEKMPSESGVAAIFRY
ncbi:hypothetical protein [Algoriphagus sp.]|uniref:baeRF3 domain-containing protein n=1 Tax=Algoriphagus sp. TaxID=1872435 RepID=UPI00391D18E7